MLNANKLFKDFVSKWASTYNGKPVPESKESLKRLKVTYNITLPKSYIDFLSTVGPVNTSKILNSVVEIESELGSLQDISSVDAAIKMTNG
jgi:hypothetical protein